MQCFIPSSSLQFATSFLPRRSAEPTRACSFDPRRIRTGKTPQARVQALRTRQVTALPTSPPPTQFSSSSIPLEIDSSLYSKSLVILTGATGFTGSVILYKLLRDCPGSHIVVLARPQNALSPRLSDGEAPPPLLMHLVSTRLWRMISTAEVFSKLREGLSESQLLEMFKERISVMQVDFSDPNLGVPKGVLQSIIDMQSTAGQNEKSFRDIRVLHCGSNVKFHDRLRNLMHDNVRATINIIEMLSSLDMPVSHFVYVSSAYTSSYKQGMDVPIMEHATIDEEQRLLKSLGPTSIDEVAALSPHDIDLIEARISSDGIFPNNYVYSKLLAEELLVEWVANTSDAERPVLTITRPTVICAAWKDPYPGFVSSREAFCALYVAYGKGLVQRFPFSGGHHLDIVPVDVVANAVLLSGLARHSFQGKFVVHVGSTAEFLVPFHDLLAPGHKLFSRVGPIHGAVLPCVPTSTLLLKKDGSLEEREDFPSELRKPAAIARRVEKQLCRAFSYFMSNSWIFDNSSLRLMIAACPENVAKALPSDMAHLAPELDEYLENFAKGIASFIEVSAK